MYELCPYTSLYNEPSQWSVFGFLPPNWAWWAWHLIVCPLWESHYLNTPQWQLQWKILRNNLVKCNATLSHVAQKLCGDWCVPVYLSRKHSSTYTTVGLSLHWDCASHVPKMTIAAIYCHPSSALSLLEQFCIENRWNKLLSQVLTGGPTWWIWHW